MLGDLCRKGVGVLDAIAQSGVIRFVVFRKGLPGTVKQFRGPGGEESAPVSGSAAPQRRARRPARMAVVLLAMMVVDQIDQGGFEIIAKSPSLRIGAVEVAANKAQGKLLSQLVGDVGIAHGPQQIAIRCPAVACQESRQIGPAAPACAWCASNTKLHCVWIRLSRWLRSLESMTHPQTSLRWRF